MKNFLENYKFLTIVIIATVFGIVSGFVGQILSRAYLIENTFDVPLFTEIDFRGGSSLGNGLVISNPKKVVVEQNEKVGEIVASAPKSIVSIFKKIEKKEATTEKQSAFNLDNYYKLTDSLGEAFIITSDGWLIANYTPVVKGLKTATTSSELNQKIIANYVVIHEGRVYDVSSIVVSPDFKYSFWKIDARDLIVKEIVRGDEIANGQIFVGVDRMGRVELTTVKETLSTNTGLVKSSDAFKQEVVLSESLQSGYFFFDLAGAFVGFVGQDERLELIGSFSLAIENLLSGEKISKPFYGLDYILLSDLTELNAKEITTGALIYQDKVYAGVHEKGLAERIGLKSGDIIKEVNNISINQDNDLAFVLSLFKDGDSLDIEILREGEELLLEYVIK